jgi:hypothetical protein
MAYPITLRSNSAAVSCSNVASSVATLPARASARVVSFCRSTAVLAQRTSNFLVIFLCSPFERGELIGHAGKLIAPGGLLFDRAYPRGPPRASGACFWVYSWPLYKPALLEALLSPIVFTRGRPFSLAGGRPRGTASA